MDSTKQRTLNAWLRQQSKLAKRWLYIAIGLGLLSTLFLLAQTALLSSILYQIIIEHRDKGELILSFVGVALLIPARALCAVTINGEPRPWLL